MYKKLFEEYKKWLQAEPNSFDIESVKNYTNTADMLIGNLKKPLQKINKEDIAHFFARFHNPNTFNSNYYHIIKLLEFFKHKNILNLTMENIGITPQKKGEQRRTEIPFEKLVQIRTNLKEYPSSYFLFEMAYQHGLTLEELSMCNSKNYNSNAGNFTLETKKDPVYISKELQLLIKNNSYILDMKTKDTIKKHFTENITSRIRKLKIDKQITWSHINASHKYYCFRCFNCDKRYENIPENWAVAEENDSDRKFIICVNCARKFEEGVMA